MARSYSQPGAERQERCGTGCSSLNGSKVARRAEAEAVPQRVIQKAGAESAVQPSGCHLHAARPPSVVRKGERLSCC